MTEFESTVLGHCLDNGDGTVRAPTCCGQTMRDVGGCAEGCCDDYRCDVCNKKVRVSYGD